LIKELMMRNRLASLLSAVLMLSFAMVLGATAAAAQEDVNTEDVIFMNDLRELRGHIISETPSEIVFEYINRELNLRSKITLKRADIAKIERDVAIPAEYASKTEDAKSTPSSTSSSKAKTTETAATYGIRRTDEISEFTKKIYVIPMEGQMGTDVNPDVYKDKVVKDIRALDPDYIVIKMKCMDFEDRIVTRWGQEEANPNQSPFLDMYRDLVSIFRDELRDIPQVMWVEDSVGVSSVIAMAWPDMYMMPHARFGGLEGAAGNFLAVEDDFNTLGKYREAYMAWLKGFAEYGGYDLKLLDAMVRKEFLLSASWEGRDVMWKLDDSGEYIVDMSDKHTVNFRAKDAEDFGISDGTAETVDDLALLLGIREYVVLDSVAEKEFTDHKEGWRRALDQCIVLLDEFEQYLGWATGEDTVRYLGRCKDNLEKVLAALERYKAVEYRLAMYGVTKFALLTTIEQLKERIRAARNAGGGGIGGGGTGTGRGGGPRGR
jgi:hypothetical protein